MALREPHAADVHMPSMQHCGHLDSSQERRSLYTSVKRAQLKLVERGTFTAKWQRSKVHHNVF